MLAPEHKEAIEKFMEKQEAACKDGGTAGWFETEFSDRVTELLGIEHPVIGGCMQHISGPEFVAAICNAGALGIMSSAMFASQDEFRDAVRTLKSLTGQAVRGEPQPVPGAPADRQRPLRGRDNR